MQNDFLIQGFLKPGELVILASPPKAGKTSIASAMALAIAKGARFARVRSPKGDVLWLALEESPEERGCVMHRARNVKRAGFFTYFADIRPDSADGLDCLQQIVLVHWPTLIVVDPLCAAQSGRSNARTLAALSGLAKRTGSAILVLHHLRTYNATEEIGHLMKYADAVWFLQYHQAGKARVVTLTCESRSCSDRPMPVGSKHRHVPRPSRLRYLSKSPLHYQPLPEEAPNTTAANLLATLRENGHLSSRSLAKLVGITHGSARNLIADLRRRRLIQLAHKSSRTTYYTLMPNPRRSLSI